jgi:hypothetical protein
VPDMNDDRALLSGYLLGRLDEAEADRVEDQFAGDEVYFDLYLEVERLLVRDYAAGRMEAAEAALFERNYLVTAERRQQVAIVRALRAVQADRGAVQPARFSSARKLVPVLATTVLVAAVGVYWNQRHPVGAGQQAVLRQPPPDVSAPTLGSHGIDSVPAAPRSPVVAPVPASASPQSPDVVEKGIAPAAPPFEARETSERSLPAGPASPQVFLAPPRPGAPENVARLAPDPAPAGFGVVTLKDGRQISGLVESGSTREIRIEVGNYSQGFAIDQIQSIQFDPVGVPVTSGVPQSLAPRSFTLPAGTEISIRTATAINSKKADTSTEYQVSMDDPVTVNGVVVVPMNANAWLRATDINNPKLVGRASMSTTLVAVTGTNGERIAVTTGKVDSQAGSHAKRTLAGEGVGAGAAIGAAAGGGLGAGVGAATGGTLGAAIGKMTGNNEGVTIPSETRYTYTLAQPTVINCNSSGG